MRDLALRGEAVVVELADNQYLLALLTYNAFLASKVFQDHTEYRVPRSFMCVPERLFPMVRRLPSGPRAGRSHQPAGLV